MWVPVRYNVDAESSHAQDSLTDEKGQSDASRHHNEATEDPDERGGVIYYTVLVYNGTFTRQYSKKNEFLVYRSPFHHTMDRSSGL
jgi:hypothetical protein